MDPMTQMQQNMAAQAQAMMTDTVTKWWKTALETQVAQMNAMLVELGKVETKGVQQAGTAIDEVARLGKAGLEASAQLQAAWRRIGQQVIEKV